MDQETREYLEGFAKSINGRFDSIDARLGTVETQLRHTNVLVEDLRGQIQLVAEGVDTANERLDRLEQKVDQAFDEERSAREAGDRALDGRIQRLEMARG